MKISFVNNASLLVSHGGIRLMMDFWREGSAFDNSWRLLCDTPFDYADFAGVTHLWFSHEHPDHFSPQDLKAIPAEIRARIVVLFQATRDKRLVSFCSKLGFASVVELQPYEPIRLGPEFELTCAPFGSNWGEVDSWCLVRTPDGTFLNINDCEIHDAKTARAIRSFTGPVDLLATQFSYASKQGERGDPSWTETSRRFHETKLALKLEAFEPRYALPFASFAYWSHRENRYLNEGVIRVHEAAAQIERQGVRPIVMYPGDEWVLGEDRDNSSALSRYAERYDWCRDLPDSAFQEAELIDPEVLTAAARRFTEGVLARAPVRRSNAYLAQKRADRARRPKGVLEKLAFHLGASMNVLLGRAAPGRIFVTDHEQAYELSLEHGLRPVDLARSQCQIAIGSQALLYCFSVSWGGETLQVNGRFDNIETDGWRMLRDIFFLARRLEQGAPLPRHVMARRLLRRLDFGREKAGA